MTTSYKAMRGYVVFTGKHRCFREGETIHPQLGKGSKFKVLCGGGPYKQHSGIDYWEYMIEVPSMLGGWRIGLHGEYIEECSKYHKIDADTMVTWVTTNDDRCIYISNDNDCVSRCEPCIGERCPFKEKV